MERKFINRYQSFCQCLEELEKAQHYINLMREL
jgi:hypothetical protein